MAYTPSKFPPDHEMVAAGTFAAQAGGFINWTAITPTISSNPDSVVSASGNHLVVSKAGVLRVWAEIKNGNATNQTTNAGHQVEVVQVGSASVTAPGTPAAFYTAGVVPAFPATVSVLADLAVQAGDTLTINYQQNGQSAGGTVTGAWSAAFVPTLAHPK